ncbi:claudin-12 [Chiloscyllium plagiosum]|uniref:claudin-12 n=1 Tax=Chiloscyllium plagiosum TaxID=36176 RepID=UPI001CB7BA74|nr:claudin-12 [Chiloscyllium plagiosum]
MSMACHGPHVAPALALLCGLASASALLGATLLPQWRLQQLQSPNRNDRNVTVSDGLWSRCVRFEGPSSSSAATGAGRGGCALDDPTWYRTLDQLDLRCLQFALPLALLAACSASLLCLLGMCHGACSSKIRSVDLVKCLVNAAGCQLVAGTLYLLSAALVCAPSLWLLFHTAELSRRHPPSAWSPGPAAFLALGSGAGLFLASGLLFLWYCTCRPLPPPFWQPLGSYPESLQAHSVGRYSRRSRLSTLEIDIPVVPQQIR